MARRTLYFRRKLLYLVSYVKVIDSPAARRVVPNGKRPGRNRRIVQFLLVFFAIAILVDGLVGDRGLLAMLRARQEYDQLAATIARQRAENARLREEARRLANDRDAIEEIAKRQLGLIKPGEIVFIIKDAVPPSVEKTTP
jgi:cell division protein FtsB